MPATAGSPALVGAEQGDRLVAPAARGRSGDPRQGEPVGVGQLPRLAPSAAGARAAASGATRTRSSRTRRLQLRLGGGGRGRAVRGHRRDRDRRRSSARPAPAGSSGSSPRSDWSAGGIVPIALAQDTAGPIARSVVATPILLDAIAGDPALTLLDVRMAGAPRRAHRRRPPIVLPQLRRRAADRAVVEAGLDLMRGLGATWSTPTPGTPTATAMPSSPCCCSSSRCRSREYLATLGDTHMRTLADLIAFNNDHCDAEMHFFGQEIFEMAERRAATSPPEYAPHTGAVRPRAPARGIDAALAAITSTRSSRRATASRRRPRPSPAMRREYSQYRSASPARGSRRGLEYGTAAPRGGCCGSADRHRGARGTFPAPRSRAPGTTRPTRRRPLRRPPSRRRWPSTARASTAGPPFVVTRRRQPAATRRTSCRRWTFPSRKSVHDETEGRRDRREHGDAHGPAREAQEPVGARGRDDGVRSEQARDEAEQQRGARSAATGVRRRHEHEHLRGRLGHRSRAASRFPARPVSVGEERIAGHRGNVPVGVSVKNGDVSRSATGS